MARSIPANLTLSQGTEALRPEVVDPRIADVEAMARLFDYAFELPGGFRFGLAGIIGLVPGIGDVIDACISLYIVVRAVQLRISRAAIARMLVNVGLEAFVGSVPVAGDLFVVAFKANRRNYELLRRHMVNPRRQRSRDWWFLALTSIVLLVCLSLPIIAIVLLLRNV